MKVTAGRLVTTFLMAVRLVFKRLSRSWGNFHDIRGTFFFPRFSTCDDVDCRNET